MKKRKIIITGVLLIALTLTLILPALANPNALIPAESSTQITRDQYNQFGGVRHTSNNSTRAIADSVTFVADNRNLNLWYIHVTADLEGTIEVAYQISNRHFARTVNINGPGRYIIGDSRGQNGLNEIKLGAFVPAPVEPGPGCVPGCPGWTLPDDPIMPPVPGCPWCPPWAFAAEYGYDIVAETYDTDDCLFPIVYDYVYVEYIETIQVEDELYVEYSKVTYLPYFDEAVCEYDFGYFSADY